jgi:hypothetical protein
MPLSKRLESSLLTGFETNSEQYEDSAVHRVGNGKYSRDRLGANETCARKAGHGSIRYSLIRKFI